MQKNISINKTVKILGLTTLFFFLATSVSRAQIDARLTDRDFDGLSDQVELQTYKTNPELADTDGDGVQDYQEIFIDKTDPLNPNDNFINQNVVGQVKLINEDAPWAWYIARFSGIASFIMFTLVISMGLLMTSKVLLKVPFLKTPDALKVHSFNATFIAFSLLILHFMSLMFDEFIRLTPFEVLVPFTVKRDIVSALGFDLKIPIGLGVIALYLAIVLILTSHFRRKIVSVKMWRTIHYSSFFFFILFVVHGITAGTDTKEPWMIAIYVWSVAQVTFLILLRIFGKKYFLPIPKPMAQATNTNIQAPPVAESKIVSNPQ